MKILLIENTWLSGMNHGWGNGYVVIPEGHPAHGKDYTEIDVDVHGGLTFAKLVHAKMVAEWCEGKSGLTAEDIGGYCVGFDTAHLSDTIEKWPKQKVYEETSRLRQQLIELQNSPETLQRLYDAARTREENLKAEITRLKSLIYEFAEKIKAV